MSDINIGDNVIYKTVDGVIHKAVVTGLHQNGYVNLATIKFKDTQLIPSEMSVSYYSIDLDPEFFSLSSVSKACDCGLKFVREGGLHSTWCSAYRKS